MVENDEFFAIALLSALNEFGHDTIWVRHAHQASALLGTSGFECVISDAQEGLNLLKWTRENQAIPVILMTAHPDSIDTKSLTEMGASNILIKPFSTQEIERALGFALGRSSKASSDDHQALNDGEFIKLPPGTLLSQGTFEINLYEKRSDKFIKVATRGEPVNGKTFQSQSGEIELYAEREGFSALLPLNMLAAKAISSIPTASPDVKMSALRRTSQLLLTKIRFEGLNELALQNAKDLVSCVLQALDTPSVSKILEALNRSDEHIHSNCLGAACIGVAIARALNWAQSEIFKVAVSGYLHDIGKLRLAEGIVNQPRVLLTITQRNELDHHPLLGKELLEKSGLFHPEIPTIVGQHHENNLGTGYPLKLERDQIHPIARLIHVADSFCEYTLKSPNSPGMPAQLAAKRICQTPNFEYEYCKSLKRLVVN